MSVTFEEVIAAWINATEAERDNFFGEGDMLVEQTRPDMLRAMGFDTQEAFLKALGSAIGMSRRTLYARRRVATTFERSAPERDYPLRWGVFLAAAGTDDPAFWAARAVDETLSAAALADMYKLEAGQESDRMQVEKVLSTVDMRAVWFGGSLALMPVDEADCDGLRVGDRVQVSAWREKDVQIAAHEEN
jgi:hypothetical protein